MIAGTSSAPAKTISMYSSASGSTWLTWVPFGIQEG